MDLENILSVLMIPFFTHVFRHSKEENKIKLFREGFIDITTKIKMATSAGQGCLLAILIVIYNKCEYELFGWENIKLFIERNQFILGIAIAGIVIYFLVLLKENNITNTHITFLFKFFIIILNLILGILLYNLVYEEKNAVDFKLIDSSIYFSYITCISLFAFIGGIYSGLDMYNVRDQLLNKKYKIREEKDFKKEFHLRNILLILSLICVLAFSVFILIWNLSNNYTEDAVSFFELIALLISIYSILDTLSWVLIENNLYQTHKVRILDDKQNIYAEGYIIAKKGNIVLLYNYASLEEVSLDNKYVSLLE